MAQVKELTPFSPEGGKILPPMRIFFHFLLADKDIKLKFYKFVSAFCPCFKVTDCLSLLPWQQFFKGVYTHEYIIFPLNNL